MKARKLVLLVVVAAGLLAYHNNFTATFPFDARSIAANSTERHLWAVWQVLSPPHHGGAEVHDRLTRLRTLR